MTTMLVISILALIVLEAYQVSVARKENTDYSNFEKAVDEFKLDAYDSGLWATCPQCGTKYPIGGTVGELLIAVENHVNDEHPNGWCNDQ